jgi:hypothetical protein
VINSEKIIAKPNQPNELTVSHLHSYIGWRGYIKGLGAMSAEERMEASAKGYENGLGAMSAEERMEARAKSMLEAGITWEERYNVFKSYDGMPERGTLLHTWQRDQLSNGAFSLNAKIRKENEENEGSFVWRKRRVELADCVEQKNRVNTGNAWERKFDEFKSYDGMPKKGNPLYTWQQNQLSNGASSLNAKIRKENEVKEGRFVWRERRVELADCVAQKRRE